MFCIFCCAGHNFLNFERLWRKTVTDLFSYMDMNRVLSSGVVIISDASHYFIFSYNNNFLAFLVLFWFRKWAWKNLSQIIFIVQQIEYFWPRSCRWKGWEIHFLDVFLQIINSVGEETVLQSLCLPIFLRKSQCMWMFQANFFTHTHLANYVHRMTQQTL